MHKLTRSFFMATTGLLALNQNLFADDNIIPVGTSLTASFPVDYAGPIRCSTDAKPADSIKITPAQDGTKASIKIIAISVPTNAGSRFKVTCKVHEHEVYSHYYFVTKNSSR